MLVRLGPGGQTVSLFMSQIVGICEKARSLEVIKVKNHWRAGLSSRSVTTWLGGRWVSAPADMNTRLHSDYIA